MNLTQKRENLKKQIQDSFLAEREKEAWLILIDFLKEKEIEELAKILSEEENLRAQIKSEQESMITYREEANQKIKAEREKILEIIDEKIQNEVKQEVEKERQEKLSQIRQILTQGE